MSTTSGEVARPKVASTATMTEVMIEPAKPIVVHSVPPTREAPASTEVTSSVVTAKHTDVGTMGEKVEVSTTVSSVTQQLTQPTEVTSGIVRPEHADADIATMKVEVQTAVTSLVEAPAPVVVKATPMEVVSTVVRGPEHVERGIGERGEEISTTVSSVTKEEVHPTEVISSDLGPHRTDSGVTAPTKEVVSTVTSVSKEPTPKVVMQTMGMMTEPAPVGVHRGTETVQVEEPMPIIQKESAVIVRSAPPVDMTPAHVEIKYSLAQSPYQLRYEGIISSEVEKRSILVSATQDLLPSKADIPLPERVILSSATTQVTYIPEHRLAVVEAIMPTKEAMQSVEVQAFGEVEPVRSAPKKPAIRSVEIQALTTTVKEELTSQVIEMPKRMSTTSGEVARPKVASTATMTEVMIEPAKPIVVHSVPPTREAPASTEVTSSVVTAKHTDVGTMGEKVEVSTTVSSVTQQLTQPTEVTSGIVRPEHADADIATMKVEVQTAVTSLVEAPAPVVVKATPMEVVSTVVRGPEHVERGIGERGEEISTTVSSVTKEEVHPTEVISSDLGPHRTDSGVTAPTKEVVSTVTSVSKEPTPKVVMQTMGMMTEPAPVGVHRGTETVQVEEPMPIIQKESAVIVRSAPPVDMTPAHVEIKYSLAQSPYQLRYEGIISSEVEKRSILVSATQDLLPSKADIPLPERVILSSATTQVTYIPEHRLAVVEAIMPTKEAMQSVEVQAFGEVEPVRSAPKSRPYVQWKYKL
ncbi:Zonadhesin [Taenia crassiceps]|uniref:Zonadhesin n=1 Tax=Taenia crassiceps TaxID=6207 RepID=A0ABR4QQL9_9CEST